MAITKTAATIASGFFEDFAGAGTPRASAADPDGAAAAVGLVSAGPWAFGTAAADCARTVGAGPDTTGGAEATVMGAVAAFAIAGTPAAAMGIVACDCIDTGGSVATA